MRDGLGRSRRRARAATGACLLALALALAACSAGGTATPAPRSTTSASATTGLPAPPPTATLPPTPPTGTAAHPGTPGIFAPAPGTGTPTAGAAATASRAATPGAARRETATRTPLAPTGEHPEGWRVYAGALPFTIAYPPDWSAEEDAARGLLYLYGPDPARTIFLVIARGAPENDPNLDVLRDRWFQGRTAPCARFAVTSTGEERHSGLAFATVGATCDLPGGLAYSLTGIGLLGTTPWIYELDAPYGDFARVRTAAFDPILATWQIRR